MGRLAVVTLVTLLCLPSWGRAQKAQTVTIKLGTMAPDGSSWHNLLKEMGERWSAISAGKVKLKVYAGGIAGNEGDMVRKMRIGQLNAAALSVVGLHDIETSAFCIATPGLVADDAEQEHIIERMAPILDQRFLDKGFVVLTWGDTGTVHIFSKKSLRALADMKGMKMSVWAGDPSAVKGMELAGFQPVVISPTDTAAALETGMIEGFAMPDIMAFAARWYQKAPTMIGSSWGHLPGATIVRSDTWLQIPADLRPKLAAVAQEFGMRVNAEVARIQADAVAQMKMNGLRVVDLPAEELPAWYQLAEKTWPAVRGGVCTEQAFDEIKKARDDYRAAKSGK